MEKILNKEDCQKILNRSFTDSIQFVNFKISRLSEEVSGFMSDNFRLSITFSRNTQVEQMTYFLKTLPQANENQLKYVNEAGIFKKEVLLYQNLLTDLLKISYFGPKSFFVKDNCIVLEDLTLRGFSNVEKAEYLNEDLFIEMLKTVGRFHASSIIFEENRNVKLDEKFKNEIYETSFSFTEGAPRQKWLVTVTKCIHDLLPELNIENSKTLRAKINNFVFEELPELLKPSKQFRNVLTHDDLWCNNLMFNSKSKKCLLVDFQMVRYTPPVFDFLLSLYINLKNSTIDANFEMFKNVYFTSLQEELKNHGHSENLFTREEFERSLRFYKLAALTEAAMYGTHVYVSQELSKVIVSDFETFNEFSFLNRTKFVVKEFRENVQYRNRLCNVLVPFIKHLESR